MSMLSLMLPRLQALLHKHSTQPINTVFNKLKTVFMRGVHNGGQTGAKVCRRERSGRDARDARACALRPPAVPPMLSPRRAARHDS